MAKVYTYGVNGDVKAAKLYFELVGNININHSLNTKVQNQNNYIQINGTVLSQDTIKNLNNEQLGIIEAVLKSALPVETK